MCRAGVPGVEGNPSPEAGNPPGLGHNAESPAPGQTWRQKTSGPRVRAHCREKDTGSDSTLFPHDMFAKKVNQKYMHPYIHSAICSMFKQIRIKFILLND